MDPKRDGSGHAGGLSCTWAIAVPGPRPAGSGNVGRRSQVASSWQQSVARGQDPHTHLLLHRLHLLGHQAFGL